MQQILKSATQIWWKVTPIEHKNNNIKQIRHEFRIILRRQVKLVTYMMLIAK